MLFHLFLDIEINIVNDIFVYKLFETHNDFPFFIILTLFV